MHNNVAPDTFLVFDPSSTRTGYAVFVGGRLREFGLLKPRRERDPANARIRTMVAEAFALVGLHSPAAIVIEDTSGKVSRRHGGAGAGLAVHGKAVDWFCGLLDGGETEGLLHLVPENEWTRGVPKGRRQHRVAALHRNYDPAADPGGDAADAIGLGEWWLLRRRMQTRQQA